MPIIFSSARVGASVGPMPRVSTRRTGSLATTDPALAIALVRSMMALASMILLAPPLAQSAALPQGAALPGEPAPKARPAAEVRHSIDVNRASLEDLRSIRGIGPARARRILAERAHGPFRDLADLVARVPGLGEATARQLVQQGLRVSAP